ncbi:MAG: hypothetical protein OHK0029_32880 [Armatimonadaceae bacterium]
MKEFDAIYHFVRTIPAGKVMSYGDVGRAVGATPRTVGWAMSQVVDEKTADDPVPWHRVVGADGYLRIARRSPELKRLQKELLEAEGVGFTAQDYVQEQYFVGAPVSPDPSDESSDDSPEQPSENLGGI